MVDDLAIYTIQDGLTAWGLNSDLSDTTQVAATNYLGNVVMFPATFSVPRFGTDEYFQVFPSTAVFSTILLPTGSFFNNSSASQPPDITLSPFGFNALADNRPADFDFHVSVGAERLLATAQAFQNKVFYYTCSQESAGFPTEWSVKVYNPPSPRDPIPTPTPGSGATPDPTPALLSQGNPAYIRNGTWDARQPITAPFQVTAMTSTVGQDAAGNAVINVWLGGDGQITVYQSRDGTSFYPYTTTPIATDGTVKSLSATPIVFATTKSGNLAQGQGTLFAWTTDGDSILDASILTADANGNPVVKPVPAVDGLFPFLPVPDLGFDTVCVGAGTARSGTQGVNAVQFFLTKNDSIFRAEYVIPQNAAGSPELGSFTSIGGSYFFTPLVNGQPVTVSRICGSSSSLNLVTTADPQPVPGTANSISIIQDSLVLLGTNNPLQTNSISALIMKSNVLVPWGVDSVTKTAAPYQPSSQKKFTDDEDYQQWKLLGVILGLPPFTANNAPNYEEEASEVEITTSSGTENAFETESENSITAGIVTPEDPLVQTEDRLTYSYFFTQSTSTASVASQTLPFSATPEKQKQGWLVVLQPNVTTQLYKMSDWASTPITLDGTPAGEYIYYSTTYQSPILAYKEFDLADPDAHPWSQGLPAFPESSALDSWSYKTAPANVFNAPEGVGAAFVTGSFSQRLHIEEGQSEGQSVTFTQETEKETNDTRSVDLELSLTTFGVYAGSSSSVSTSVSTKTDSALEIKMSEKFQPGLEYSYFDVDVYGFVLSDATSVFVPTIYQDQLRPDKAGNPGSKPFLFAYSLAGSSKDPTLPDTTGLRPTFATQPASQEVGFGTAALLTGTVSNPAGVSYLWFKDGKPIAGATANFLSFSPAKLTDSASYVLRAANAFGASSSATARITVAKRPVITRQPNRTAIVFPGEDARFEVAATGEGILSYQWFLNNQPINGATKPVYAFKDIPASLAPYASVFVRIANAGGTTTSSACRLNIVLPPTIVSPPASTTVRVGDTAIFDVAATSENRIYYGWLLNGAPIPGADSPRLTLPAVALSANDATIEATVRGAGGSVTTTPVRLTVVKASAFPGALILRGSQSVNAGRTAIFQIQLVGDAAIQWFHDGSPVRGATSATLGIGKTGADAAGLYTVRLTNAKGTTEVVIGTLRVSKAPPAFVVQPENLSGKLGIRATLSARVASRGPVRYQWLRNGKPVSLPAVSGAKTCRLVFETFIPIHAGDYVLQATNAFGSVKSRIVRVRLR